MKVFLLGARGKVGSVLGPALEEAGHEVLEAATGADAAVDFTRPEAVEDNVRSCLEAGVPVVVGTSGFDQERVAALAREHELPVFYAPNFAVGAVLMMRFAAEAGKLMPHAEIVELHHETKLDAPSGTAKATAALLAARDADPLRASPGSRRPPGGDLRRSRADADDPPRHDVA